MNGKGLFCQMLISYRNKIVLNLLIKLLFLVTLDFLILITTETLYNYQIGHMQLDNFQYPHDNQLIETHIQATRIGKDRPYLKTQPTPDFNLGWRQRSNRQCSHCGRYATCCESQEQLQKRYGIYGPNCVLYLGFIKRIAIYLGICTVIFAVPLLILNATGDACQKENYCIKHNWVYRWSVYNVVGVNSLLPEAWIWLGFTISIILFTIYLRYYTLGTYRRINNRNTTDSDYSLMLRRLPEQTTPQEIKSMIEKQLDIMKQFSMEKYPHQHQQGYIPYVLDERNKLVQASSPIRDIIMLYEQKEMMEEYEQQLDEFKQKIRDNQYNTFQFQKLSTPTKFGNAAIVRFYDKQSCLSLAKSAQIPFLQKIINYACVFYKPKSKYEIHGERISLQLAPHPTDMLWQNLGFHQHSRIAGKILTTAVAFFILIISSAIALAISYWIQIIINRKDKEPILLTVLVATIVFAFNKIIRKRVMKMTRLYKLDNRTDEESEQIMLIVLHESLNMGFFSVIAPILVKLPDAVAQKTMKSSSFPTVMVTTILMQAILASILDYIVYHFELKQKIYRMLHNRQISIKTQSEAMHKYKGQQVPFVKCYAFNVKMVWFGFLYGVVVPISIFIAFVGMLITYYFQKSLFNDRYSIPFYGRSRINYQMIDLLDWTPLLVGLFNIFLYKTSQRERQFSSEPTIMTLYIIIVIIGIVHLLIPWSNIIKRINRTDINPEVNYNYNRNHLEITYEQANPVTRPSMNISYRQNSILQKLTAEYEQRMQRMRGEQKQNKLRTSAGERREGNNFGII